MASGQTEHYGLNQWQAGDQVLREEFNRDNQKVDGALTGLAGQVAVKADQTAVDGLAAALAEGLAQKGNCQLTGGTYVGTGGYNTGSGNTLTFDRRPVFVIIVGDYIMMISGMADRGQTTPVTGYTMASSSYSWTGNTLYWASGDNAGYQMNADGRTYYYFGVYLA